MSPEQFVVYAVLLLLTAVAPFWSILAFVIVSPWNAVNDLIGWDPRLCWSLILALRACVHGWNARQYRFPPFAVWSFCTFVLLALIELEFGTDNIAADDANSAWVLFLYFLSGAAAMYSIVKLANGMEKARRLATAAALSLLLASVFGLLQAAVSYFTDQAAVRIPGTLGNANYFAAYLSMGATIIVLLLRLKALNRTFGIAVCCIALITCLFTLSRMGVVACLVGITVAALIRQSGKLLDFRIVATMVCIAGLAVILALGYLLEVRRTLTFSKDPNQAEVASMLQHAEDLERLEAVEFAWASWERNPIFGVGVNTIAARNLKTEGMYVTTHDTYMQVLAGTGIVGLFLIASVTVSVVRSVWKPTRRYLLPVFGVMGLCSFFGDYLQSVEIFVLFASLLAALQKGLADSCEPAKLSRE